jgi:selenide,water dikinase
VETADVRLTQYSHGAGCGCKISPRMLAEILQQARPQARDPRLLVGFDKRDDAAVYLLDDEQVLISTTDFFTPIVDDPFAFGAIAAVNAISDVYAMGGRPILAIAILGWPVDRLPAAVAGKVLDGARASCARAGIPLAGGHSIDAPEPIFGLAVNGLAQRPRIRSNDLARAGDELYLTKPLGIGVLTTAQKRGILSESDLSNVMAVMLQLNDIGVELSAVDAVRTMTDVTGFGLLGHLLEICEASGVAAEIQYEKVPKLPGAIHYMRQGAVPGGTKRNFDSYGHHVGPMPDEQRLLLCDPQTSGGLLVAVNPAGGDDFLRVAERRGLSLEPMGRLVPAAEPRIVVG